MVARRPVVVRRPHQETSGGMNTCGGQENSKSQETSGGLDTCGRQETSGEWRYFGQEESGSQELEIGGGQEISGR